MIFLCIIFLIISLYFFIQAKHITNDRTTEIYQTQTTINKLQFQLKIFQENIESYRKLIQQQQTKYQSLVQRNQKYEKEQTEKLQQKENILASLYKQLESQYQQGYFNYVKHIDEAYSKTEQQFIQSREKLNESLHQLQTELTATAAAKRREEEKQNNINFYKIQITDKQKQDIKLLQKWKESLNDPSLVSKIIWSSCIMKPTGDLCNRLTQGKTVCGIYKITSLISSKCYIGQSVNISDRIKTHVKCGLGIDASTTNKLYNLMQEEGVYNFTFEIIEQCSREKLNERERFWIQTYQSDKFGVNNTKGNTK